MNRESGPPNSSDEFLKCVLDRNARMADILQGFSRPIFQLRLDSTNQDIGDAEFRANSAIILESSFRRYYGIAPEFVASDLKKKLDKAMEALEFYADKLNWRTNSGKIGVTAIWTSDQEITPEEVRSHQTSYGGKLARETLKKLKEDTWKPQTPISASS